MCYLREEDSNDQRSYNEKRAHAEGRDLAHPSVQRERLFKSTARSDDPPDDFSVPMIVRLMSGFNIRLSMNVMTNMLPYKSMSKHWALT